MLAVDVIDAELVASTRLEKREPKRSGCDVAGIPSSYGDRKLSIFNVIGLVRK